MLNSDEAKALVEQHGSQRAAARALGVPKSTFYYWLHPDLNRQRAREWRVGREEYDRERNRKWYADLSGFKYARLMLRHRRDQALRRMREREERRGTV